ncbi:MAG: glycine cleavage system protein GcvH [Thiotrichales bacterium]
MSQIPVELKYTKSHEWVRDNGDGSVTIGISDHAQALLGDLVYVELPAIGRELEAGTSCAVVESVKAASDVYAPVSGTVMAVNATLSDEPEQINRDPYDTGWLFQLQVSGELGGLLDAAGYAAEIADA